MYRSKGRRRTHARPPRPRMSRADHAVGDD
jgi:hypothetical protein